MIKYATNPQGEQIEFHAKNHAYIFNGEKFKSVTTLVSEFFTPFDTERISFFYARKHGLDQQQVKNEWAEKGRIASEFGDRIHSHMECLFKNEPLPKPIEDKDVIAFNNNLLCYNQIMTGHNFIEAEKIVFSKRFRLSGTIDLILECKKDGAIIILDWKSTKSMDKHDSYGKSGKNGLEHLDDCNFNHYSLQLNLYRKILEEENYYPGKEIRMGIVHVNDKIAQPMKIDVLNKEVEVMLN